MNWIINRQGYLPNVAHWGKRVQVKLASSTAILNNMFKSKPNVTALASGACLTVIENSTRKVRTF
jgi:hypothetical protein